MRNTIRKVITVVPVLITNCQVSEKPNKGPVMSQTIIMVKASTKTKVVPEKTVQACEILSKILARCGGLLESRLITIFISVTHLIPYLPHFDALMSNHLLHWSRSSFFPLCETPEQRCQIAAGTTAPAQLPTCSH